ncbi:MmyB family transcriptional regulator [Sporosarcina sp. FSL K6-5500]|uniref:MmyB family transcriptional regulator n=1 Tax=Sporosarcina sp. FSL K6-5500 TaxID=2921558 RepID=UPI004046CBD3
MVFRKKFRDRIQNLEELSAYSVAVWRSIYDRFPEDEILNDLLAKLKEQSQVFKSLWKNIISSKRRLVLFLEEMIKAKSNNTEFTLHYE